MRRSRSARWRVREQPDPQRVGAAARHAVGEVFPEGLLGLFDLRRAQVARLELIDELRQRAAVDDLQRVDDVPERLGHLPALLVADHRVQVDVGEGERVRELQAHHDHARDPEEEDVEARFQEGGRIERPELVRVLGPAHHGEREQAGREPRVQDILVPLELDVGRS